MRFERRQWWIIAAAALVFALVFGVRQSQALFISPLNSATGLGIASISLAFAAAQLMWGITQPFAGAVADRYGSGRVIALGGVLVMLGTVLTPHAHSTWMLILLIGVVAAGGAGMAGLGVLMSAVGRAVPPQQRGLASGIVNAGGSFGQFAVVPVAQLLTGVLGWVGARSGGDRIPRRAEDDHHLHRFLDGDRLHLSRHGPADGRAGRQAPRHAFSRDPLRHRDAIAPDRRFPRRLARRPHVRDDRQLCVDVVRGRDARVCSRPDPP